jgi:site-specific recombinase XerD/phage FluMu protein Com
MSIGDIHKSQSKLDNCLKDFETLENISEHNRELILDFYNYLQAEGLSTGRIRRILYSWKQLIDEINWKLDEVEKDELVKLVGQINQNNIREKELSDYTLSEYKQAIRKFYVDYMEKKRTDFDGEELCNFFTTTVSDKPVDPDRLPTPKTVENMVKNTDRTRDKALIMTIWSSGGRIGEVLGLKWKDVLFQDEIVKVHFRRTKTGDSRKVPLRAGLLYLQELQEKDERSSDPEAFIFRNLNRDKQLSHAGVCEILRKARENTDIPARIKTNPHAFRKGRATYLASEGMNQAQLCQFGGWVQGSSHVAKYVRMADSDVEQGIKELTGLDSGEDQDKVDLTPVKCYECKELNKFEAENCSNCGTVLKSSKMFEQSQIDEATDDLMFEIATSEAGFSEEEIKDKAQELVDEKFKR